MPIACTTQVHACMVLQLPAGYVPSAYQLACSQAGTGKKIMRSISSCVAVYTLSTSQPCI